LGRKLIPSHLKPVHTRKQVEQEFLRAGRTPGLKQLSSIVETVHERIGRDLCLSTYAFLVLSFDELFPSLLVIHCTDYIIQSAPCFNVILKLVF